MLHDIRGALGSCCLFVAGTSTTMSRNRTHAKSTRFSSWCCCCRCGDVVASDVVARGDMDQRNTPRSKMTTKNSWISGGRNKNAASTGSAPSELKTMLRKVSSFIFLSSHVFSITPRYTILSSLCHTFSRSHISRSPLARAVTEPWP